VRWCLVTTGTNCNPTLTGNINNIAVSLAPRASSTFIVRGTVVSSPTVADVVNTATVTAPNTVIETNLANNTATDSDHIPTADLSIVKTHSPANATPGQPLTYSIVVTNNGPDAATGATVSDNVPTITGVTWTCAASAGASCATASGSGNISNRQVNLPSGGKATFTLRGTVPAAAVGTIINTATVTAPGTVIDPNAANNSATDSALIAVALPTSLGQSVLDNFNRTNANNLGGNWSQAGQIRVLDTTPNNTSTGVANAASAGTAYWNAATFNSGQGAALTFANPPASGTALVLKATGNSTLPTSYIRVRYSGTQVVIETTANLGVTFSNVAAFNTSFASGDTLSATAYADGTVYVYKGSALIGGAQTTVTGNGRVGFQLPNGARIDNFKGRSLP
jgi:uncharacterized repeat protein (TIGR01451 family)